ncbi:MAG: HEAT repeat domain-containing protein [Nitrososphaerales archaeon]
MEPKNDRGGEPQADERTIASLIATFQSGNGRMRQAAREHLCEIGEPAVPALIEALSSPEDQVRWEAAKALTHLPDPRAADALVATLKDSFSIRWLASEALINIGLPALEPLVRGLLANPDAPRLRESAHHVLTELKRAHPTNPYVAEMLEALSGQAQTETVPWVARDILLKMGRIPSS